MFQRDYFMRMIAQMTEAIGQIMNLRRERKQEEALLVIDELLDKQFRLSSKLIRSLSDDDLMKVMSTNGHPDTDQLQAIALLLKQEGLLNAELGREAESFAGYVKSLKLFLRLSILGAEPTLVEPEGEIRDLLDTLRPYELPVPVKRLLMAWHEAEGRYAGVEDVMYELIEDMAMPAGEAAEIYERLLKLEDVELEAGGLPREEILQGLAGLSVEKCEE
ncbi:DUF6483 family protein [Paenibacillus sp. LHD-117]|uniref:DUF6483 family protein n=1 Tax=Paenibacillus sp. LHD-117 TaxID=3071412 RepID=UPI0027E02A5B|nr:DUF6483 family protein [Paenibacillus sp. LHD-117]MDQ6420085.1 DUF6483 family protein [Paenibacillus sp. LHD-117]